MIIYIEHQLEKSLILIISQKCIICLNSKSYSDFYQYLSLRVRREKFAKIELMLKLFFLK